MKLLMLHLPLFLPLSYTFEFVVQLQFSWWYEFGQKGEGKVAHITCVVRLQGTQGDKQYEWPNCRKSCSHSFYVFRCQSQSVSRCSTTGKQVSLVLLLTEWLLRRKKVSFRLEQKVTPFASSGLYTGVWKSIREKIVHETALPLKFLSTWMTGNIQSSKMLSLKKVHCVFRWLSFIW